MSVACTHIQYIQWEGFRFSKYKLCSLYGIKSGLKNPCYVSVVFVSINPPVSILCVLVRSCSFMASSSVKNNDPEPKVSEVNVFKDPFGDPTSAYYLHLHENLGVVLVYPQLSEQNYHSWSRNMRITLFSKNKLKFVDGSIFIPERRDPLFEAWKRCSVMVLSWINRTLSTQIVESVVYIDIAKNL